MSLEQVKKHLQGKHPQKSHGKGGGGGKPAASKRGSLSKGISAEHDKLKSDVRKARRDVMDMVARGSRSNAEFTRKRGALRAAQGKLDRFNADNRIQ